MRWPKPEIVISAVALGISAMSFAGSSVWNRASQREDAVRTERRAAYGALLGILQRCGLHDSFDESEAESLGEDVDDEGYEQRLVAFRSQGERYLDECAAELSAAQGVIELLAEDQDVIETARQVQEHASVTLDASWKVVEAVAEGPQVATPEEPWVITVNAFRAHRDEMLASLEQTYAEFRVAARADAQEPAPGVGDYLARLGLWLLLVVVTVSPLIAVAGGVVFAAAVLSIADRIRRKYRSTDDESSDDHEASIDRRL